MLLLMVFVSGCGQAQAVSASVLPSSSEPASVSEISQVQSVSQIVPESYGEGYFSLEDDDQQAPDAQQIQLILNYMDLYYESMARMEPLDRWIQPPCLPTKTPIRLWVTGWSGNT